MLVWPVLISDLSYNHITVISQEYLCGQCINDQFHNLLNSAFNQSMLEGNKT